MHQLIFVYGTLKQGYHNHYLMHGASLIGAAHTVERYAMYKHVVPYVVKNRKVTISYGEIHSIQQSILATLDLFEGNPVWNFRELVEVILDADGTRFSAWMYFNDTAVGQLVESGVYTMD